MRVFALENLCPHHPPPPSSYSSYIYVEVLHMALPSPPFVNVDGVRNLRDIGGYSISTRRCTRRRLVYRSADFSTLTEDGLKQLEPLKIKAVFDLRSKKEVEKAGKGDTEPQRKYFETWTSRPDGPRYNFVPVFDDDDYSPEALAERFKDYASEGTKVNPRSDSWPTSLTVSRGLREHTIRSSTTQESHSKRSLLISPHPIQGLL